MKILHQDGFNQNELLTYRTIIYRNLVDSAKALVQFLRQFDILPANPENLVPLPPITPPGTNQATNQALYQKAIHVNRGI
jgi:guanine nucleotide-binding protein G(i) subunit alpha